MDLLTEEERALAWAASWHPSFSGISIVNKDFTFRSVNHQFCEILGVSPAELIGQRFQDITPLSIRSLDEKNAQLVMNRMIDSYLMPKTYEFANGKTVQVILLVKGVYSKKGEFLFFLSQIMLDSDHHQLESPTRDPKQISVLDFIKQYSSIFIAIGTVLGTVIWTLIKLFKEGKL